MAAVNIPMNAESARIFTEAPPEDRDKLAVLMELLLREYQASRTSLSQLMDDIGARAKARGLTAEQLDAILSSRR
jgi:hypothetical protein